MSDHYRAVQDEARAPKAIAEKRKSDWRNQ
jgi:hypothetical protein